MINVLRGSVRIFAVGTDIAIKCLMTLFINQKGDKVITVIMVIAGMMFALKWIPYASCTIQVGVYFQPVMHSLVIAFGLCFKA